MSLEEKAGFFTSFLAGCIGTTTAVSGLFYNCSMARDSNLLTGFHEAVLYMGIMPLTASTFRWNMREGATQPAETPRSRAFVRFWAGMFVHGVYDQQDET